MRPRRGTETAATTLGPAVCGEALQRAAKITEGLVAGDPEPCSVWLGALQCVAARRWLVAAHLSSCLMPVASGSSKSSLRACSRSWAGLAATAGPGLSSRSLEPSCHHRHVAVRCQHQPHRRLPPSGLPALHHLVPVLARAQAQPEASPGSSAPVYSRVPPGAQRCEARRGGLAPSRVACHVFLGSSEGEQKPCLGHDGCLSPCGWRGGCQG